MSREYDAYLSEHIAATKKAAEWMNEHLDIVLHLTDEQREDFLLNVSEHDKSKYGLVEYDAYDAYFYGERDEELSSLRDECRMYRTMLNDATDEFKLLMEEYACCRDERDAWFEHYEDAVTDLDDLTDDVMEDRGWIRLPKDISGEHIKIGDTVAVAGYRQPYKVLGVTTRRIYAMAHDRDAYVSYDSARCTRIDIEPEPR